MPTFGRFNPVAIHLIPVGVSLSGRLLPGPELIAIDFPARFRLVGVGTPSTWPGALRWPIGIRMVTAMIFPDSLIALMNGTTVPAVGLIKPVHARSPVISDYAAISTVGPDTVDVDVPGKRVPAYPPGRVIIPPVR